MHENAVCKGNLGSSAVSDTKAVLLGPYTKTHTADHGPNLQKIL